MEIRIAICCGNSAADLRLIRYESSALVERSGRPRKETWTRARRGGGEGEEGEGREKGGKSTFLARGTTRALRVLARSSSHCSAGRVMSGAGRKGAPELKTRELMTRDIRRGGGGGGSNAECTAKDACLLFFFFF
jgi:hypothetical protein